MKCRCGGETTVFDTRDGAENTVRRQRECTSCGHRIRTIEIVGSIDVIRKYRDERRARKKRWWGRMSPEQRRAWKTRERLRTTARRETKETGEPVEQIYIRWGCE